MTTWIFQCNPDHYDIDGLLASGTTDILYAANQNQSRMSPGDTVYLWRSQGKKKAVAGIIAKGRLIDTPSERPDTGPGLEFWVDPLNARASRLRVAMRVDEVANKKEVIQRAWMLEDPILRDLNILKMANMSNYIVEDEQEKRIDELWENTGVSWSRAQSIAALRTYQQTYGGSLSQLPGSPIAETATLIGRAVKGVYNKVLNFRHIDPRDERAGFSGGGAIDREVWAEFFDLTTQEIDTDALDQEFRRLWKAEGDVPQTKHEDTSFAETNNNSQQGNYRPGPTPQAADYKVSANQHDDWYVYVLALSNHKAVKVGMSHDPKSRLETYNHTIMPELTGLDWKLAFTHKVSDAEKAQEIEQEVLREFSAHQLPSNGEILREVDVMSVQLAIIRAAGEFQ